MYDVRLQSLRALRGNLAKQVRRLSYGAVIGRGYKGAVAVAADGAYVRRTTVADGVCPCTKYDGRRWQLTLPMYEVRCTMYDCDYSALCAGQRSRSGRDVLKP